MKERKIEIKSKRLCMIPKALEQTADWLWNTEWEIMLKKEKVKVGSLRFQGAPNQLSEVKISLSIEEAYRRQGFGLEAVNAMTEWAFQDENVYYVMAESGSEDATFLGLLKKAGFVQTEKISAAGDIFEKERPAANNMAIFLSLGMSVGLCFGMSVFDNMTLGMCMGMMLGVGVGYSLDQTDKKNREKIKQKRQAKENDV